MASKKINSIRTISLMSRNLKPEVLNFGASRKPLKTNKVFLIIASIISIIIIII